MKRSSESSVRDGVFLIHSLAKTFCNSPEESDLKKQTRFHQEDDSGIKSGNKAAILCIYLFILFYSGTQTNKTETLIVNILLKCLLRHPLVILHSKTLNLNLYCFEVRFHVGTD